MKKKLMEFIQKIRNRRFQKRMQIYQNIFEALRDVTLDALHKHRILLIINITNNEIESISYDHFKNSYIIIKDNIWNELTYEELLVKINILLEDNDKFKSELR